MRNVSLNILDVLALRITLCHGLFSVAAFGIIPLQEVGPPYSGIFPLQYWCPSSSARKGIRREFGIGHKARISKGEGIYTTQYANFTHPKSVEDISAGFNAPITNPDESDVRKTAYQVAITTSKDYGSGISDSNSGVLLALIGEEGKSLLHRLSPLALADTETILTNQSNGSNVPVSNNQRFQRGSHDVITFDGPSLGKLQAVWIAPERGTWRIENMRITTMFLENTMNGIDGAEKSDNDIIRYNFEHCNTLIGDGGIASAVEFKASEISLLSFVEYCSMLDETKGKPSRKDVAESRAMGIKEYEMLKLSLLSYDALLVTLGSLVSAGSGHNDIAQGFCIGGMIGFLYLYLLQRAVDRIPAGTATLEEASINDPSVFRTEEESRSTRNLATFRSPLPLIIAASFMVLGVIATVSFSSSDGQQSFSKEVLFAGAAGFLMSKVSTVLASSNLLSISIHNN